MTAPTTTRFTVTKGNPTEDELAALATVLTDLQAAAKAKQQPADQNRWGAPALAHHGEQLFNPHAFANVTYF
ncbi:hypothetical protein CKJ85_03690 [Corynebacterium sp. NML 150383]|uniref:acyl-CoA carboxylase subunit epsilon n=1 Tax=Corynebacterium sp. NML 150383 TaxID=2029400 RepID=UPI000BAA6ABC|nr:acyl-CoA carboxylase subunit epsilon [Corynebacterium sp. NML 150383]PAT04512.1 hypothetical protein CKJ85_03690 [Corynebacterium sp. NML 150383]